jgi:hypothetical protein
MLDAFGRKCACCGESHPFFLTLDHVRNDGAKHRAEMNSRNAELIYQQAKREGFPKDKYQLLCMNCNFAKGHWGICPHQEGVTADDAYADLEGRLFKTGKQYQNMNLEPLKLGPLSQKGIKRPSDPTGQVAALLQQLSPEDLAALLARYSKS